MNQKNELEKKKQFPWLRACERFPEKKILTFQHENNKTDFLTGAVFSKKVKTLGRYLEKMALSQEKAMLLLPKGLEYSVSLIACMYANVIAIPTKVTKFLQDEEIIEEIHPILKDSQTTIIITNTHFKKLIQYKQEFKHITIVNVDELPQLTSDIKDERERNLEDIAIILYAAGKEVMITHGNLISKAFEGSVQWDIDSNSIVSSWMPQNHNFGAHFGLLIPLLTGASSVILSPESFLKQPLDWYRAIDLYKITHIATPILALDYSFAKIDLNLVKEMSFNSLKAIICEGGPIEKEVYENYVLQLQNLGLSDNILCFHYGTSEIGVITTHELGQPIKEISLDSAFFEEGKVKRSEKNHNNKTFISSGQIPNDVKIIIVNPKFGIPSSKGEVGEVWVNSISIEPAILKQERDTLAITNSLNDNFFRTGDLGFIEEGNLYIVGKSREVININDQNYHPVDIETTIKKNVPELTLPCLILAFQLNHQSKVVVVQEIEENKIDMEYSECINEMLESVFQTYGFKINEILLIKRGEIPKNSYGRIQRAMCRNAYLKGEFNVVYQYQPKNNDKVVIKGQMRLKPDNWIMVKLINEVFIPVLEINQEKLEEVTLFAELGLDSIQYVQISKRIEEIFELPFTPVMLFKHRSIKDLVVYISSQIGEKKLQAQDNKQLLEKKRTGSSNVKKTQVEFENKCSINDISIDERDIAVIGMSCEFPGGSSNLTEYWGNLIGRKDCISSITTSRPQLLSQNNYYDNTKGSFPNWGGFTENFDKFDAAFFGISPKEAESMDPQQRKLLELTWSVIEDSGNNPTEFFGENIGLFVGVHNVDYAELISNRPELMETYGAYLDSGLHMSMIANRVSRWFNFHGPSQIINTACSSSLVAVHNAIQSIFNGESTLAIAAGINLLMTPRIFQASHRAGMLSSEGHCKTFDNNADGFVRSEGFGAVLLKPLSQAVEDGDSIYGVIKGSVMNHDGRSNSLRAPNLNAQKQLIKDAFDKSGLTPETISYIEAHGTGTPIGDPIEVQALQEAFEEISPQCNSGFCGIGSAKTIIGHCESAAGIAGLIKVMLSMKHKTIPGNLHFNMLNSYIKLDESPFYVVDKTQEWKRLKDAEGKEIVRRAGISSFGFGGVNAHLLVEEYVETYHKYRSKETDKQSMFIIPLSAKSRDSLKASVREFLAFLKESLEKNKIENNDFYDIDLFDVAYTLQVGRADMEERVVFLVEDIPELIDKLSTFLKEQEISRGYWIGNVKNKNTIDLVEEDVDEIVNIWFKKNRLEKIAQYWVHGGKIDWRIIYNEVTPRRIHIPTYPFAKERFWLPDKNSTESRTVGNENETKIQPLLHRNISKLSKQQFCSTFTGKEFFLADHVIKGQMVLPGVAQLEMVREAVEQSIELSENNLGNICIKDIVWIRPIVLIDKPIKIHIELKSEDNGDIIFKIYKVLQGYEQENVICSQGRVEWIQSREAKSLNIQSLQRECSQDYKNSSEFYEIFQAMGIDYGSRFQGVKNLYLTHNTVLAKLSLKHCLQNEFDSFMLHPGIMDSAFQASIALSMSEKNLQLMLPYALQELEVVSKCKSEMWALIRSSESNAYGRKLDIDLCDNEGNICVRVRGLILKGISGENKKVESQENGTLILKPFWKEKGIYLADSGENYENHLVVLSELDEDIEKEIIGKMDWVNFIVLKNNGKKIEERFQNHVIHIFKEVKKIMESKPKGKVLIQVVVPQIEEKQLFTGISGFLKTVQKENPHFICQLIEINTSEISSIEIEEILNTNAKVTIDNHILYSSGKRYVASFKEIESPVREIPWKEDGVYLITGGAGGIGNIFVKEIVKKVKRAVFILVGRSTLKGGNEEKLKELLLLGIDVEYKQVDVSDKMAVSALIQDILQKYGTLNGIIHSAGIIRDNFIIKKTEEEIRDVFAPKVIGTVNLDEASRELELDFFILFSSVAGVMGNLGQADYASANNFMDSYTTYRNQALGLDRVKNKILSINWPFWNEGGMKLDEQTKQKMRNELGITAMESNYGLQAFYQAVATGENQIVVLHGDLKKIYQHINKQETEEVSWNEGIKQPISRDHLKEKVTYYLKEQISLYT
uniref:SDR family NAD(P)-dependent oxidoreductase n=1 Tax=Bacillus cereus group sp. BfR-BA-01441 TaxID=2920348 RepID=UPI001F58368C